MRSVTRSAGGRLTPATAATLRALAIAHHGLPSARHDYGELLRGGARHRLLPAIHLAVRDDVNVPVVIKEQLAQAHLGSIGTHLRALSDLHHLARVLREVPWLAFKGPVIAGIYPRPDLRPYTDLDVLVRPGDLRRVMGRLETNGFDVLDRNWPLMRRRMLAEVHFRGPSGSLVDLHWRVLNSVRHDDFRADDADALLARSEEIAIDGLAVRTLAPADTVVHLCVHAGTSGGDVLGSLADLHQIVTRTHVDWGLVVTTAHRWRARAVTAVVLARCVRLWGTPVPAPWLARLSAQTVWPALDRLAARIDPVDRCMGGSSVSLHLGRCSRDGMQRSVLAVGDAIGSSIQRHLRPDKQLPSTTTANGGALDRELYLRAVESITPGGSPRRPWTSVP